jgi:hypothetical protein
MYIYDDIWLNSQNEKYFRRKCRKETHTASVIKPRNKEGGREKDRYEDRRNYKRR